MAPRTHPIQDPATAKWSLPISHLDYEKLLKGWLPRAMEDKWMIITNPPDAYGNTVVRLCRSWTNHEVVTWTVRVLEGDPKSKEQDRWAEIVEVAWMRVFAGEEMGEEEAKEYVVQSSRGLLECGMENA